MIVVASILKAGVPREDGSIITSAGLETILPSVQALSNVKRAWIDGDEIKAEMEIEGFRIPLQRQGTQ